MAWNGRAGKGREGAEAVDVDYAPRSRPRCTARWTCGSGWSRRRWRWESWG